jgi:type II secretory pathway predicted ATPase ExeA
MDFLYQNHFGLVQAPFNVTPDPTFLYPSASHREGLAQLAYGVKARKGFVVLTGEVGTGKTTLIHALLAELGESTRTALIFSAIGTPMDLLRFVCEEFELVEPGERREGAHDYLILLNEFLLGRYRAGDNCALIIDEAQNLPAEVLESIRLLSNFETSKDKLLQILLVGQPELAQRLNSPGLRQIKQRVALRHHLRPLSRDESYEYIRNRMKLAGGTPDVFTRKALESVHRHAGGIPRLINILCDNAMLTAFALTKQFVDDVIVREVAEDLNLTSAADATVPVTATVLNGRNGNQQAQAFMASSGAVAQSRQRATQSSVMANSLAPAASSRTTVPRLLMDDMTQLLADAMGPMASIVLRDRAKQLGESVEGFPRGKLSDLIMGVSQEILDPSMRHLFQQEMEERIGNLTRR